MKFFLILGFFSFIFNFSLPSVSSADVGSASRVSQSTVGGAENLSPPTAPVLEELTVVRQKELFVARKYKNYSTTTVNPVYVRNQEL